MCKEVTGLNTSTPYPGTTLLLMGDGTRARIVGVGNSTLVAQNRVLYLSNILHVPTIRKNLLLVS